MSRTTMAIATMLLLALASCKPKDTPEDSKTVPDFIASDSASSQTVPTVATLHPMALDTTGLAGTGSAKAFAMQTWDAVTTTCPGLTLYAADLSIVGISDMHESMHLKDVRGTGVTIQVSQSPRLIPSEFGASGHRCSFRVTPDRRGLIVEKAACASICTEQPAEETGSNRIIKLKGRS